MRIALGSVAFALGSMLGVSPGLAGTRATQGPPKAEELAGTWRGERDGSSVEITFRGKDVAVWQVETKQSALVGAVVKADLHRVDDPAGRIELRFDLFPEADGNRPFIRMGRLSRGKDGLLRLTILPTARRQSELYYQLLEDFPLHRVEDKH